MTSLAVNRFTTEDTESTEESKNMNSESHLGSHC